MNPDQVSKCQNRLDKKLKISTWMCSSWLHLLWGGFPAGTMMTVMQLQKNETKKKTQPTTRACQPVYFHSLSYADRGRGVRKAQVLGQKSDRIRFKLSLTEEQSIIQIKRCRCSQRLFLPLLLSLLRPWVWNTVTRRIIRVSAYSSWLQEFFTSRHSLSLLHRITKNIPFLFTLNWNCKRLSAS